MVAAPKKDESGQWEDTPDDQKIQLDYYVEPDDINDLKESN